MLRPEWDSGDAGKSAGDERSGLRGASNYGVAVGFLVAVGVGVGWAGTVNSV